MSRPPASLNSNPLKIGKGTFAFSMNSYPSGLRFLKYSALSHTESFQYFKISQTHCTQRINKGKHSQPHIGGTMRKKRDLRLGIRISQDERNALDWLASERDMPISLIIRHC